MPNSVTDRPTTAHEYIFLLTKRAHYFYDHAAIRERAVSDHDSGNSFEGRQGGAAHLPMGGGIGSKSEWKRGRTGASAFGGQSHLPDKGKPANREGRDMSEVDANFDGKRNKRSVWTVPLSGYRGAHFATFPTALIQPCILAGSRHGDTVLDPFAGSGTTGEVALSLGRNAILCELNPDYARMIEERTTTTVGLPL